MTVPRYIRRVRRERRCALVMFLLVLFLAGIAVADLATNLLSAFVLGAQEMGPR